MRSYFKKSKAAKGLENKEGRRVAEVWMDEYKEYIYKRRPHYRSINPGDLSEQRALRDRLKCKSFKWFMTEIAFDLVKKYPLIDPKPAAIGDVRSAFDQTLCIEALGASPTVPIKLSKCIRDGGDRNGLQKFEFSRDDDIRPVGLQTCWDLSHSHPRAPVVLFACHGQHGNQHWIIEPVHRNGQNPVRIRHGLVNVCLQAEPETNSVVVNPCHHSAGTQMWIWEMLQFEAAKQSLKEAGLK